MIITVTNEVPFQILSSSFSIGPSQTGYELQVGADSRSFSTLFSVGANTPRMVTNVANGSYFRLKNNVGDVKVNWQRVCVTEGGGASGTELTPVSEFPLGAEAGTVVAYSGSSSAAGIYQFDGTNWLAAGGSVDLSAYWTSAQTQSAITAVEDHLFDVEEVTASALTELHNGVLELSAATAGKADAANVSGNTSNRYFPLWNEQGIITGTTGLNVWAGVQTINGVSKLVYGGQSNLGSIYAPTDAGIAGKVLVSNGSGAPVWSAMPAADVTKAYVDSAITEVQDQIDTMDEVVSAALVDLNDKKVESEDIKHMVKLTQAEYDALVDKDPDTFYIIVNNI